MKESERVFTVHSIPSCPKNRPKCPKNSTSPLSSYPVEWLWKIHLLFMSFCVVEKYTYTHSCMQIPLYSIPAEFSFMSSNLKTTRTNSAYKIKIPQSRRRRIKTYPRPNSHNILQRRMNPVECKNMYYLHPILGHKDEHDDRPRKYSYTDHLPGTELLKMACTVLFAFPGIQQIIQTQRESVVPSAVPPLIWIIPTPSAPGAPPLLCCQLEK